MDDKTDIFDTEAERYDAWFDSPAGRVLFENELAAIRLLWRDEFRPALEVGVGTGRFAQALGVGISALTRPPERCASLSDAASK